MRGPQNSDPVYAAHEVEGVGPLCYAEQTLMLVL
jgi:hypothetical protein